MGWEMARAPVANVGAMPREMLGALLEMLPAFRPDFALTVNLGGMDEQGILAEIFDTLGVPLVTWFVDDPRTVLMGRTVYATPLSIALTWERAYIPYLQSCGFPCVLPLPLAADLTWFNGTPVDSWQTAPSFVGNSMAEFSRREWDWIAGRPALALAVVDALESGRVTRESFAGDIRVLLGPAADTFDADEVRQAELYFFIEATRRMRAEAVSSLAPLGLVALGDDGWRDVTPHHSPFVHYEQELAAHYRTCPVNLNLTSIQMATAVNQRVFDCPAAGGFLLTDAQQDLATLFEPGSESACFSTLTECADLLAHYLEHPEERIALVQRARARILAEHTYEHRLHAITAIVREHLGL
jgi:spore maturation protein CgeB